MAERTQVDGIDETRHLANMKEQRQCRNCESLALSLVYRDNVQTLKYARALFLFACDGSYD